VRGREDSEKSRPEAGEEDVRRRVIVWAVMALVPLLLRYALRRLRV
jgi:hypothetical protein